mmetsp:Transcript_11556/g.24318  ORF Transcript_11556/g.24318 Transcript_11556/m.24318 type:complete len:212 (+) Transcript_11556:508-1143(+)
MLGVPERPPGVGKNHPQALDARGGDVVHLDEPLLRAYAEGTSLCHSHRAFVVHKGGLLLLGGRLVVDALLQGENLVSLLGLGAPQVPPRRLACTGAAVEDLPHPSELGHVHSIATRLDPAHVSEPADESVPRLLVRSEAAKQADNILLPLVRVCVPALDESEHFCLVADWHAVVLERVLYELHREGTPAGILRDRSELVTAGQHVARDHTH